VKPTISTKDGAEITLISSARMFCDSCSPSENCSPDGGGNDCYPNNYCSPDEKDQDCEPKV